MYGDAITNGKQCKYSSCSILVSVTSGVINM